MNNEPVAWAREDGVIAFHKQKEVDSQGFKWFPLYTHPAKTLTDDPLVNFKPVWQEKPELTLTDEEITEIYKKVYEEGHDNQVIALARAILRKAQEK